MPVKRVEWECPGCKRRFAIPAEVPKPALCPQCQAAPPSPIPSPPESAPPRVPPSGIEREVEDITLPQLDVGDVPSFERGPVRTSTIHSGEPVRRKNPTLRMIASLYKLLAALLVVAALAGLFFSLVGALSADASAGRNTNIIIGLGVFGGGTFAAIGLLAAAELIHVLLDIEENTRRQ